MSEAVSLAYKGLADQTFAAMLRRLAAQPGLRLLDLSGNQLTTLPDLGALQQLESLNITANHFPSVDAVVPALQSLPALVDLSLTVSEDEEDTILGALPNLRSLNGVSFDDGALDEPAAAAAAAPAPGPAPAAQQQADEPPAGLAGNQDIAMTQADLEAVATMFESIKVQKGRMTAAEDDRLSAKFDEHVQVTMEALSARLQQLEDPFLRQGEILMAKHDLYDVCFEEMVEHAQATQPAFGSVLRQLRSAHREVFGAFPRVLHAMRPHYMGLLAEKHDEVVRAEQETSQLLEAAELLEKEAEQHAAEQTRLRGERRSLQDEVDALRRQVEQGGGGGGGGAGVGSPRSPAARAQRPRASNTGRAGAGPARGEEAGPVQPTPGGGAFGPGAPPPKGSSTAASTGTVRTLTKKQLTDFIDAVYASKQRYDERCRDSHMPLETMEQHLYSYLNQRYGLKQIIIDQAAAIIKGLTVHGEDNYVAVFAKVLRNEIDEQFRLVQEQLRDTVQELLRVYLKGKYPLKSDEVVASMLAERQNGTVREEEWADVVKYMYGREDSISLTVMVRDAAREYAAAQEAARPPQPPTRGRARAEQHQPPTPPNVVPYATLLKVLQDFQLHSHDRFLAKFRRLWSGVDTDHNGIVDETQFRTLVNQVDAAKTNAQVDDLVEAADPFNTQSITFSQAVQVLSNELVELASRGE